MPIAIRALCLGLAALCAGAGTGQAAAIVSASVGGAAAGSTRETFNSLAPGAVSPQALPSGVTLSFVADAAVVSGAAAGRYAAPFLSGGNGAGFGAGGGTQPNGADTTTYLSTGSTGAFPGAVITLSFTGQTIFNTNQPLTELWVGLQNYVDILGSFDVAKRTAEGWVINYQNFYWTLFITVCWTVSNVAVGVGLGMTLALALNTPGLRFKAIYRVLLILPWAIPNYITALIWKALFHQQFGAINQGIQMFGFEPVAWFDGVFSSFLTGLATNGWLSFPFMMVVILGGLQSISADMYEAATVEGATRRQQFWSITLPLLKPTLIPAIILSVVWTFNMFNVIYLVSGGEPAGANEILITKAYKIAFEEYRYAYSAAYSTVIFLILLVYGVFQTRMTRATEAVNT
jgi:ABC-type sugar transport system permease subunit